MKRKQPVFRTVRVTFTEEMAKLLDDFQRYGIKGTDALKAGLVMYHRETFGNPESVSNLSQDKDSTT